MEWKWWKIATNGQWKISLADGGLNQIWPISVKKEDPLWKLLYLSIIWVPFQVKCCIYWHFSNHGNYALSTIQIAPAPPPILSWYSQNQLLSSIYVQTYIHLICRSFSGVKLIWSFLVLGYTNRTENLNFCLVRTFWCCIIQLQCNTLENFVFKISSLLSVTRAKGLFKLFHSSVWSYLASGSSNFYKMNCKSAPQHSEYTCPVLLTAML